jgi:hypothetical protein
MAVVAFAIVAICWIAIVTANPQDRAAQRRRVSFGLLPLLILQAAALPFTVVRHVTKPETMAPSLAREIRTNPRYANAILMSEPDVFMETMPYYVPNPIYFPRQREFGSRAYFDTGTKRTRTLTLDGLVAIADSVACANRRPVLLSIGHRQFLVADSGSAVGPFRAAFSWTAPEKERFDARVRRLEWFPGAISDENYRTYEILPSCRGL